MGGRTRFLVVRRDNIGDLVLTTPLIRGLRQRHPDAWIGALVNSYNAPVLHGNPDLDTVYAYDKAKHRPDLPRLRVFANTARLLWRLRTARIDHVILAGPGAQRHSWQLVRWLGARSITGFTSAQFSPRGVNQPVDYADGARLHEAVDVFRLLAPFGIDGPAPACVLHPDAALAGSMRIAANETLGAGSRQRPWIGVHLSARRLNQRWPVARFAELMRELRLRTGGCFLLFWSPGAATDPHHPGDDVRARELLSLLPARFPVVPLPTLQLEQLIAGLSLCDAAILADGGAMHLAAALGKPLIALFGDSPVERWRPWRVEHEIVQAATSDVADVMVFEVMQAWERLAPRVLAA